MSKLHVIFVPGLGDQKSYGQDIAIKLWRFWGVRGHYHAMTWNAGDFAPKLQSLLAQIDEHTAAGDAVGLVGFSAGASAVLNAFAARTDQPIKVVTISGKIRHPSTIGAYRASHNPAFVESLNLLQQNLQALKVQDKNKILTMYPSRDQVVTYNDATIPGVKVCRTPARSHVQSVAYSLTLGSYSIVRFFK